jgi:succinyl-CoA synthetase alpha subunit
MAIIVDENTKILVQGITGREGTFHTKSMLEYGSKILAGVTPGKGGQTVYGVPVYDSVSDALKNHPDINTSIIFVPAPYAADAVYEAIDNGIKTIVIITERIPTHDTLKFVNYARLKNVTIIGPNCPGIISPGRTKVGIMPGHVFKKGIIGMVSRSGTLTYEIAHAITKSGLGQTTAVVIGVDPVTGLTFIDVLEMFRKDEETEAVVIIGEIGGDAEERAAEYIRLTKYEKPVVAYVAGRTAPPEKRMGHAGAIISMGTGSAKSKIETFEKNGIPVASFPGEVASILMKLLKK